MNHRGLCIFLLCLLINLYLESVRVDTFSLVKYISQKDWKRYRKITKRKFLGSLLDKPHKPRAFVRKRNYSNQIFIVKMPRTHNS